MRITLIAAAVLFVIDTHAADDYNWHLFDNTDEMTGRRVVSTAGIEQKPGEELTLFYLATNEGELNTLGVDCRIVDGRKSAHITFGSEDYLAPRGSDGITLIVKVDGNDPIRFGAEMYSNSRSEGFMSFRGPAQHNLVSQLKRGSVAKVRLSGSGGNNRVDFTISLSGSTNAINQVLTPCGL